MANLLDDVNRDDVGRALLRVSIGGMMLLHGVSKLSHGITGITEHLVEKGVPAFVGQGVFVGEVVAPLMLILGLGTRLAGAVLAFTMVVAIGLVHSADIGHLNPRSGAWAIELPMLYLAGGVCCALLGAGRLSISRGRGRFD